MKLKTINNINNVWVLTKRNILLFFRNKTTVFFSLLAPVLILVIFVIFMGDIQVSMVESIGQESLNLDKKIISNIVTSWMVSGVIGIACLTVGLNSLLSMVHDKENSIINDFRASPIGTVKLLLSYFFAAVIITFSICLVILTIIVSYLWLATGVGFTFNAIMQLLVVLLLSCLSAVMFMMCIMSFFKTNQSSAAFTGTFSALIGFLTGAYFPLDLLPEAVQGIASLIPGTHSAGLFRNLFVGNILNNLPSDISADFINQIKEMYSFNLHMFGTELSTTFMYWFLACSVGVLFCVYFFMERIRTIRRKSRKR